MKKLALSMIVKDDTEAGVLERCLSSVARYVDGIYITTTNTPNTKIQELANRYKAQVSHFKWDNSFENARNFAFSQVPKEYEYLLWLDSDDVVINAQKIPKLLEVMEAQKFTSILSDVPVSHV
jgi:glycosyltransferase involved in cell wall biosynthesis